MKNKMMNHSVSDQYPYLNILDDVKLQSFHLSQGSKCSLIGGKDGKPNVSLDYFLHGSPSPFLASRAELDGEFFAR